MAVEQRAGAMRPVILGGAIGFGLRLGDQHAEIGPAAAQIGIDSALNGGAVGDVRLGLGEIGRRQVAAEEIEQHVIGKDMAVRQRAAVQRARAPRGGDYILRLDYDNPHGPISTGLTAAVKRMRISCAGAAAQEGPLVMPQSQGWQRSTTLRFHARAGALCRFELRQGFNMSFLKVAALYTGQAGGAGGPLNSAGIGALLISPLPHSVARALPESATPSRGAAP